MILKSLSMKRRSPPMANGKGKDVSEQNGNPSEDDEETAMLQAAATVFGDLMDDLAPPLKALSV